MGQSPSVERHDNASTRTLHSSVHSNRPMTFFRRISHRLHNSHPRFGRNRPTQGAGSTTSSVRRATQEAARAAVAVTGPNMLYHYQHPVNESSTTATSDTSTDGRPMSLHTLLNRQRNSDVASLSESEQQLLSSGVSVITLAQLQSLLRSQGVATSHDTNNTPPSSTPGWVSVVLLGYLAQLQQQQQQQQPLQPQQPQRQQQTQQPSLEEDDLLPPNLPFVRLRRPRSGESTSSSTDTIRSMPLSTRSMPLSTRSARSNRSTHSSQYQHRIQPETSLIFILHSTQVLQALSSLSDNPSYEDLLMLGSILGQARAPTTTQAAVDEAIPATQWSETTQKELKGTEQCLVCLDEFVLKQAIRILKCRHVFHRECVDRWLCESHNSCPVCRGVPVS